MNKRRKKVVLAALAALFCGLLLPLQAQVTIGSNEAPAKAALLDIKQFSAPDGGASVNSGGIVFPRVNLELKSELYPFIHPQSGDPENDAAYLIEKTVHKGLVVYNLSDVPEEDLEPGLYQWTGSEWRTVSGDGYGKAMFYSVSCADIKVMGSYTKGVHLDATNYITINLNVKKKGSYLISIVTPNGYGFVAQGLIVETGPTQIVLLGQGLPAEAGTDVVSVSGISVTDDTCLPTINVAPPTATYLVDCGYGIIVNGIYKAGVPTDNSNTITLPVYVSVANSGASSYRVYTNTIDGLSFCTQANTSFSNTGYQNITLYAQGTPQTSFTKKFSLFINSADGASTDCTFEVVMVKHKMRVLSVGDATYSAHATAYVNFMQDTKNFGNNGIVKADNFTFETHTGNQDNVYNALVANTKPDIVMISYAYSPNAKVIAELIKYVNAGGVLIYFGSGNGASFQSIANSVLGASMTVTSVPCNSYCSDCIYPFLNTVPENDPLINGPFGSVRGGYWGEENDGTFYVDNLPSTSDIIVYSSVLSSRGAEYDIPGTATIFRSTKKNLVCVGDSWAASSSSTAQDAYAAYFNNNSPATKMYGTGKSGEKPRIIYNSIFFGNILAWAVERAQFYGINALLYK